MKIHKYLLCLICFCYLLTVQSQFNGGISDGFAVDTSIKNLLVGEPIAIFFGGIGDGFATDTSIKNLLEGEGIAIYFGGIGDGFAVDTSVKNLLTSEPITIYFGGIGDGFAVDEEALVLIEQVRANIVALLQGPSINPVIKGLMNDDIRAANLLPTTSPYGDGSIIDNSVLLTTGENAVVDWILVELRDGLNANNLIASKSALLQRDGDIVDLDGDSALSFETPPDNYYVVVKHRNHLGVMSAGPIALTANAQSIDFADTNFQTFGSNAQVILASGNNALWAGDTNGDKVIQFSGGANDANAIKDYILADPLNILNFITFSSNGYLPFDVDMNAFARFSGAANDSNILKDNVLAFPGNILGLPTFSIMTTVPPIND